MSQLHYILCHCLLLEMPAMQQVALQKCQKRKDGGQCSSDRMTWYASGVAPKFCSRISTYTATHPFGEMCPSGLQMLVSLLLRLTETHLMEKTSLLPVAIPCLNSLHQTRVSKIASSSILNITDT